MAIFCPASRTAFRFTLTSHIKATLTISGQGCSTALSPVALRAPLGGGCLGDRVILLTGMRTIILQVGRLQGWAKRESVCVCVYVGGGGLGREVDREAVSSKCQTHVENFQISGSFQILLVTPNVD